MRERERERVWQKERAAKVDKRREREGEREMKR